MKRWIEVLIIITEKSPFSFLNKPYKVKILHHRLVFTYLKLILENLNSQYCSFYSFTIKVIFGSYFFKKQNKFSIYGKIEKRMNMCNTILEHSVIILYKQIEQSITPLY